MALRSCPSRAQARGIEFRLLGDQPSEILRLGGTAESLGTVLDDALEVMNLLLHELREVAVRGIVHATPSLGHDLDGGACGNNAVCRLLGGFTGGFDDDMTVVFDAVASALWRARVSCSRISMISP